MEQSVASAYEIYLARSDLRPASVRIKRKALAYFTEWFGDLPVGRVNLAMAEDFRTMLAKGRSKVSANSYLANFKPFWNWLRRHNRIESNPFESLRLYRITEQQRETFSAAELGRLICVSSRIWRVRICLGLLGCRRGETLNVITADVRMVGDRPHIALTPKRESARTWKWEIKDHATRFVGLPEQMAIGDELVHLHRDVLDLMDALPDEQPYLCIEPKYYRRMMALQQSGLLTDVHVADPTGNFQRSFRALQRRALIGSTKRYHELRAAFATTMISAKGIGRAADALGHSSTNITRKYDRKTPMSLVADINETTQHCYSSVVP